MSNKKWSKEQNDRTRDILDRLDVVAFSFDASGINKGCNVINDEGKYGYVKLMDALNYLYPIYDYESDQLIKDYDSIDDLIKDGWKVST